MSGYLERFAQTEYVARFLQQTALTSPHAQALIVGPLADPPIHLRLTPLEAHFFLQDRDDA